MVIPVGWPCDRAVEVADGTDLYNVNLSENWPYDTLMDVSFLKLVSSSSASSSSQGSTEIGNGAFALPGFRAPATVYGITGRALLTLPAREWRSADQLREAVRGLLPSGIYLVKFEGLRRAVKLPVGD